MKAAAVSKAAPAKAATPAKASTAPKPASVAKAAPPAKVATPAKAKLPAKPTPPAPPKALTKPTHSIAKAASAAKAVKTAPVAKAARYAPAKWSRLAPARPIARPAYKPVAKAIPIAKATTVGKVASAAKAAAKAKPIAKPAAKPQPSIESLTRDANNSASAPAGAASMVAGGQLDIAGQIGRTLGALVIVLLLVAGGLYALRRTKLVAASDEEAFAHAATAPATGPADKSLSGLFSSFGAMAARNRRARDVTQVMPSALEGSPFGNGILQIVGAQSLPGSGAHLYLVRIENHMVLIGASYAGGVRMLAEWENVDEGEAGSEQDVFDAYLREQGVAGPQKDDEEHTFASIRSRLNSTAERLADLNAKFEA